MREQEIAAMRLIMEGDQEASSERTLHFWATALSHLIPAWRQGLIFYILIGPKGSFTQFIHYSLVYVTRSTEKPGVVN